MILLKSDLKNIYDTYEFTNYRTKTKFVSISSKVCLINKLSYTYDDLI